MLIMTAAQGISVVSSHNSMLLQVSVTPVHVGAQVEMEVIEVDPGQHAAALKVDALQRLGGTRSRTGT